MYEPAHFVENDRDRLFSLMQSHPLGLLVSNGDGVPVADPVPFVLDTERGRFGTLKAHVARANPHWKQFGEGSRALAVFQGPQAYVTPAWYATKRETGKVVPTWNYLIVQAEGDVTVHDDAEWLRRQVDELTASHETGRAEPWAVSDAPEGYVTAMLRGIVGLEIAITRLTGKWKTSQNRSAADRAGVHDGLVNDGFGALAATVPQG